MNVFDPLRYEDEINKRTECENDFVLIKKVSIIIYFFVLNLTACPEMSLSNNC